MAKLYSRFRVLVWGRDLGRARRLLVLSILSISILGRAAYWAEPKIDRWLWPPPPMEQGTCTQRPIFIGGFVPSGDITIAKKWVGTTTNIPSNEAAFVWNESPERLELWMTDGVDFWMIEVECFAIRTPGKSYVAKFGEFEKITLEELKEREAEYERNETGL